MKVLYCKKQEQIINPKTKNGTIECIACDTFENDNCTAIYKYIKKDWLICNNKKD